MNIEIVIVGDLECNCYVLSKNDSVLVIDPGDDADKIKKIIGNKKVLGILVTHHHFDHVGALNELIEYYNTNVYDYHNLEEKEYKINDFKFKVIRTLGHKDDAVTFYFEEENVMFVGDFIFKDNIGRCDLPGGNIFEMMKSIEKIKEYDDDIIIYSGHGDITNLGYEKTNNYYFKCNWY